MVAGASLPPSPREARLRVRLTWTNVETLEGYLTALASSAATPGGGSAAAIVAASGAALLSMVGRIYSESPKYAPYHELVSRIVSSADALRGDLLAARERDEKAFARVMTAHALPQRNDAEKTARASSVEKALFAAAAEPLKTAGLALDVLRFSTQLVTVPNKNLMSDIGCAAEFGYAGLAACGYNVRINHRFMRNAEAIAQQATLLARYESEGNALLAAVRGTVGDALAR
jgi:methenyltetrahydrofolate cyclohydrolase